MNANTQLVNAWIFLNEDEPEGTNFNEFYFLLLLTPASETNSFTRS